MSLYNFYFEYNVHFLTNSCKLLSKNRTQESCSWYGLPFQRAAIWFKYKPRDLQHLSWLYDLVLLIEWRNKILPNSVLEHVISFLWLLNRVSNAVVLMIRVKIQFDYSKCLIFNGRHCLECHRKIFIS